jgi:hypothetical protein
MGFDFRALALPTPPPIISLLSQRKRCFETDRDLVCGPERDNAKVRLVVDGLATNAVLIALASLPPRGCWSLRTITSSDADMVFGVEVDTVIQGRDGQGSEVLCLQPWSRALQALSAVQISQEFEILSSNNDNDT